MDYEDFVLSIAFENALYYGLSANVIFFPLIFYICMLQVLQVSIVIW